MRLRAFRELDIVNMRLFGEVFAWSENLDEKDRDGLRQFCLTFIESDTERREHDSKSQRIEKLKRKLNKPLEKE